MSGSPEQGAVDLRDADEVHGLPSGSVITVLLSWPCETATMASATPFAFPRPLASVRLFPFGPLIAASGNFPLASHTHCRLHCAAPSVHAIPD
jgi:hypothetical protein